MKCFLPEKFKHLLKTDIVKVRFMWNFVEDVMDIGLEMF